MHQIVIKLTTLSLLILGCGADDSSDRSPSGDTDAQDGGADGDGDGDADGDADTDADTDGDTDPDTSTDNLGEPMFTGDCDCDGELGNSAEDLAIAMNLCDSSFLKSVKKIFPDDYPVRVQKGYDTLADMGTGGCLTARHGCEMAVLATGIIGAPNPNVSTELSGEEPGEEDPAPAYQGDTANPGDDVLICDNLKLQIHLKVPEGARTFSFDFLFGSSEYDEYIHQEFNDTFYAILEYENLNGGETTNIVFDDNGGEIEVDADFFENDAHPCDETGSGWEPKIEHVAGTTGWLRTFWHVSGGDELFLTFSIHDEGDCHWDSIVFIDNFQWYRGLLDQGTGPVV